MKKILFTFLIVLSVSQVYSQTQKQLDSILKEADLLYKYEKVAWNASDLVMENQDLKNNFGDYIVYHTKDSINTIFVDPERKNKIVKYAFSYYNVNKPIASIVKTEKLSKSEKNLFDIKYKIIDQLGDSKYNVFIPSGFSPNLILIKDEDHFRFYVIMGTSQANIIPMGNDFYFKSDLNGNIKDWKKYRKSLVPVSTVVEGNNITNFTISNSKNSPYITATDICTFRLYADYYGLLEFTVLSTFEKKKYTYSAAPNLIDVKDLK